MYEYCLWALDSRVQDADLYCAALEGVGPPVVLATILMAATLAWFMTACLRSAARRKPAPKKTPKVDPVAAQLAQMAAEIADLREQVEALVALQREGKAIYYTTSGGHKLHAADDCRTLQTATEIEELPLDPDAAAFFYKIGAVCVRCAGPHAPSEE